MFWPCGFFGWLGFWLEGFASHTAQSIDQLERLSVAPRSAANRFSNLMHPSARGRRLPLLAAQKMKTKLQKRKINHE
jgi:hypothetical protein